MISDGMTADQILQMYRDDVNKLAAFLPYLQSKQGDRVSSIYADDGLQEHSVAVPVYDGNLMSFIKIFHFTCNRVQIQINLGNKIS